jgi:hypothetical protein
MMVTIQFRPVPGVTMITSCQHSRKSLRHAALENRARLEWCQGGEVIDSSARLINVSEGGILLDAENSPPPGQTAWCRLEEPTPTDWIKVKVVRRGAPREIGLSFLTACPFDFTMAATLGLNFDALFLGLGSC